MGQKKRSSVPRSTVSSIPSSNGSLLHPSPSSDSVSFRTIRSLVPVDADLSPNAQGNGVNTEINVSTNGGEHTSNGGTGISKGLEVSKTCQEDHSNVKSDCEKALVALRRGNSNKALRLIRDACVRYDGNALVQRIRGHICMRLASMIEDVTTKQKHLKDAIDAAQKAVLLSPRSVEYAQFHAQLLFETATDSKGYEEVVQECQRALEIEDPVDPAKESLHEEVQHRSTTAEARIQVVQQELRNLVQKANIASISNWMKTLGTGGNEEKLRFIHMRKLVDDPMEQRISQPKRPHEVKKSVKTAEEKRKDIEVRVAAARLLQQKRDCSPPHSDDGSSKPVKGSGRLHRRKSGGANTKKQSQAQSIEEKIERLKPFWNSLSPEEREKMLEIPLDAFKQQFMLVKPNVTSELLSEALEFAQGRKTWRFWMCWNCGERCTEYQEHAEHITDKHTEGLPTKLRRLFPREVDHDIAEQILSEDCRPFDGPLAIKLLISSHEAEIDLGDPQNQQEPSVSTAGFDCASDKVDTSIISSFDSPDDPTDSKLDIGGSSIEFMISDNAVGKAEEQVLNINKSLVSDARCNNLNIVAHVRVDTKGHEFPYAADDERTKLLQKIYSILRILLRNKCLASDHMEKIMQYAHDELKNFIPVSSVHYEFSNSLIYVRFLPALQLRRVLSYLRELANACGLDQQLDTGLPASSQNEEEDVILDRLFLNEDLTILSLDERLLKETSGKYKEVGFTTGNGNSMKHQIHDNEVEPCLPLMMMKDGGMASHADMQLSWIYGTADYEHQPGAWKQYRETRAQQGREIFREMEKEFLSLQNFCEKKHEQIHTEAAVNMAEALCVDELKKRELKVNGSLSCHDAVLRKRKQDLLECRETGLSSQQKLELEVITSMLRDARTVNLRQFPYDSSITLTSAHLSDSDEEIEDAWRVPDFVPQSDSHIELAIQWKKDRCTSEINKLDARILRSMDTIQKLEHKLGSVSVLDYRSVVLPLVKTFLKAHLEEAAEKDAMQKSEAAKEAFLAELSRDGKTTIEKLSDSARYLKEKSKDKKKNKEQKRSKDVKQGSAAGIDSQQNLTSENADEEDGLEWELDESQKLIEAELKRQAEVEDEERKLAETLELQRRIEEEAKEKHLAELRKKNADQTNILIEIQEDADDMHSSTNPMEFESVVSTSFKDSELAESLPSSAVLMNADILKEVASTADSNVSVDYDNHMAISSSDLVVLPHSEIHEPGSSRPKRSGKNRRRRLSRASHEDSHISTNGEQTLFFAGQSVEQTKSVMDYDISECNGTLEGVKPIGTGRNLTTNSSSLWDRKQSGNKDGGNIERIEHSSDRTLRELKAEQDAEERFQADLEQAMRQSLVNAAEYTHSISEIDISTSSDIVPHNKRIISEEVGKGLQNEIGQYNCFLNVVIQSLWHLQRFREELLDDSSSQHVHMGDPCVLCALREIFVGLNSPSSYSTKEIVAPTTLRIALSNLSPQKDFFQEAQMNDASEVLAVVFECIHKAFATNSVLSDGESDTGSGVGFWECHDTAPCIAHSLFALDIARQMNCTKCGLESRHLKYTTFFHNINANSLRTAKILYQENSLDQLLRLVEMNEFLACDVEMGGCGQQNYIHYLLRAAPHVFITVLGWQNSRESFEDISATMDAIAVDLDVGIVYCGLDSGFRHKLVSVICYYGQHYHCFAFNHEIGRWVMFDDTTVKVIGTYEDVMDTCRRGHLQPQVLFYEASER